MYAPIRLSMFQCIVQVNTDIPIKELWSQLQRSTDKHIVRLTASPPGSLHKRLSTTELHTHQVGSIHITLRYMDLNISVLIFSTHKMKVSSGLQQLEVDDMTTSSFWEFITHTILKPCVAIVYTVSTPFTMVNGMVNANIRQNLNMQFAAYLKFVDNLALHTGTSHDVHLPSCLVDADKHGRRCATKYKRTDRKGSLMFDHSGNIQAFAYKQLETLVIDVQHLCNLMSNH